MVGPNLKLYIIGETSPDPQEWRRDGSSLVLAESPEQARELFGSDAKEVEADRPMELMYALPWDYTMGEDV